MLIKCIDYFNIPGVFENKYYNYIKTLRCIQNEILSHNVIRVYN